MKKPTHVLSVLAVALILAGCMSSSPQTATTVSPAPAGSWRILRSADFVHYVYLAGFLDDSFGITVGFDGEIHYTNDGGVTWPQADNQSLCRFGLDVVDTKVAWSCGNGGHVRMSTDGGRTWQAVTGFGPDEPDQCRFLRFLDATTGWAATPSQIGMTTDGGQTWKDVALPAGVSRITAIDLRTPTDGYLFGSDGKLYMTADGGATWTSRALDFTADALLTQTTSPTVAMRFTDEKHGMVVLQRGNDTDGYRLWSAYTADGGQTWAQQQLPTEKGQVNLFLSHDGTILSALDNATHKITVLRFQQP